MRQQSPIDVVAATNTPLRSQWRQFYNVVSVNASMSRDACQFGEASGIYIVMGACIQLCAAEHGVQVCGVDVLPVSSLQ